MKQFKDFRIFKKVVRKYWKRHAVKQMFFFGGRQHISWWVADNIWCYYIVNNPVDTFKQSIRGWFVYDIEDDELDSFFDVNNALIGHQVRLEAHDNIWGYGKFLGYALVNNGVLFAIENEEDHTCQFYTLNYKLTKSLNNESN